MNLGPELSFLFGFAVGMIAGVLALALTIHQKQKEARGKDGQR